MALSGIYPRDMATARYEATSTTKLFELGTVSFDNCGGRWIYVKASEILTAFSLCHLTAVNQWLAEMSEAADIATGPKFLGLNQVAFAANDYGWLFQGPGGGDSKGVKVRAANATAGALLHPLSGTAGAVDDANVDEGVIAGLSLVDTVTTIAATECILTTIITCNLGEVD